MSFLHKFMDMMILNKGIYWRKMWIYVCSIHQGLVKPYCMVLDIQMSSGNGLLPNTTIKAIYWASVSLPLISQEVLMISITEMSLKMTYFKI